MTVVAGLVAGRHSAAVGIVVSRAALSAARDLLRAGYALMAVGGVLVCCVGRSRNFCRSALRRRRSLAVGGDRRGRRGVAQRTALAPSRAAACSASSTSSNRPGRRRRKSWRGYGAFTALYARDRKLAVGHLGTLDPQAAGVLPVAIGQGDASDSVARAISERATRARSCSAAPPTTQDALGETVEDGAGAGRLAAPARRGASPFVGKIAQVPPMYSAAPP